MAVNRLLHFPQLIPSSERPQYDFRIVNPIFAQTRGHCILNFLDQVTGDDSTTQQTVSFFSS